MQVRTLFFGMLLSLICFVPASAQSGNDANPATFSIIAAENKYNASGSVFTMEITNLAEEFYLMNLFMDQERLAEDLKMSFAQGLAMTIEPFELNNDYIYYAPYTVEGSTTQTGNGTLINTEVRTSTMKDGGKNHTVSTTVRTTEGETTTVHVWITDDGEIVVKVDPSKTSGEKL